MFSRLRKEPIAALLVTLLLVAGILGATSWSTVWSRFDRLWVSSDTTTTATQTLGADDVFIKGDLEVGGTLFAGTPIEFNMAGWAHKDGNDVDDNSVPRLLTRDDVPALVWSSSRETSNIQQTFRLKPGYNGLLEFYALFSSDTNAGLDVGLNWRIWVNGAYAFDTTPIEQGVVASSGTTHSTSNELLTLTVNATGLAAISIGDWITIEIQNATSHTSANFELKGFSGMQ